MKLAIVFIEGIADVPRDELGGATPLEHASTPHMDALAGSGVIGQANLYRPRGAAGVEAALYSVLGGDPDTMPGRGVFDAFYSRLPRTHRGRVAAARLVTSFDGRITDLDGGALRDAEARALFEALNERFAEPALRLYALGGNHGVFHLGAAEGAVPHSTPPERVAGRPWATCLPTGAGADRLRGFIEASGEILADHPVNQVRSDLGEPPANLLWLWGVGDVPPPSVMVSVGGEKTALVSQVPWAVGLGMASGLDPQGDGDGIVGSLEALGDVAQSAFDRFESVIAHCAGPRWAGYAGDALAKSAAIESIDRLVVGPIRRRLELEDDWRLAVVTAIHSDRAEGAARAAGDRAEFSPFLVAGARIGAELGRPFTERSAAAARMAAADGAQLREFIFATR